MRRFMLGLTALATMLPPFPAPAADANPDDAKPDKSGWVALFNGKDLTGWKVHPHPSNEIREVVTKEQDGEPMAYEGKLANGSTTPLWHIDDGVLIGSGPSSHLFSERGDYVNFRYRVEAMINDGGNSGQYFRTAYGPGFPKGYEAQINATHGDPVRTGSLYPAGALAAYRKEIVVLNNAPHKPDEWFTQEVTIEGSHVVIAVNGKKTVDWTDPKGTYSKGHFALQGHDPSTVVKFRKIEVKELPASVAR